MSKFNVLQVSNKVLIFPGDLIEITRLVRVSFNTLQN
jgi:hypothetical protein